MAFSRKLLNDTEDVVLDLKPHWVFLAGPVAAVVGALVLAVVVGQLTQNDIATYFCIAVLIVAMVWLFARYLKWVTTNFVVTTDRLIYRHGVFAKSGIEMPLERVNNVIFKQTVLERLTGSGDLLIESAGESGQQRFSNIRRPSAVQNEIQRQMEDNENRKFDRIGQVASGASGGGGGLSLAEQLEKLDALRQRGVLTQAEFDAEKAQLLRRR